MHAVKQQTPDARSGSAERSWDPSSNLVQTSVRLMQPAISVLGKLLPGSGRLGNRSSATSWIPCVTASRPFGDRLTRATAALPGRNLPDRNHLTIAAGWVIHATLPSPARYRADRPDSMEEPLTESATRAGTYVTAGAILAIAVGPPVVAIVRIVPLQERPFLTTVIVVAYEALLWGVAFVRDVSQMMRKQWVRRSADGIDAWILRRTSRYTRHYLAYVTANTRYLDNKGLSTVGEVTLKMDDVLVNLALASKPVHALSSDPVGRGNSASGLRYGSIWEWLREGDRERSILAVVGPPGSGKTTLLRSIAHEAAAPRAARRGQQSEMRRIPILINVREHASWLRTQAEPRLGSFLRRALPEIKTNEPPNWVETNLRKGRFAILLDGLDELPDATHRLLLTNWIENEVSAQEGNIFVVSSRPAGYRESPVTGARVVEVQPFTSAQIDQFIEQWYVAVTARAFGEENESSLQAAQKGARELQAALDATGGLHELATNPLLLTMIANVHHYRGALPGSRVELYAEICDVFLGKRHEARGVAVSSSAKQRAAVLKPLAHHLMAGGQIEFEAEQIAALVQPLLDRISFSGDVSHFLMDLEASSGLVVERERGRYAFCHLTFQEFLAASHLKDLAAPDMLSPFLRTSWWRETIRMYAGLCDATQTILELVHSKDPRSLALAALCVRDAAEVSPKARIEVERALRPGDARTNPPARSLAATASIELRVELARLFARGRWMSEPVPWIEYQLFLDNVGVSRVPDHWREGIYPDGADFEPAVGVRYSDALTFCKWVAEQTSSGSQLRLPHAPELEEVDAARESTRDRSSVRSPWVDTPPDHAELSRFWPLLREDVADPTRVPIGSSISQRGLAALLKRGRTDLSLPDPVTGMLLSEDVQDSVLELFSRYLQSAPPNDLEQCVRDIEYVQDILASRRIDDGEKIDLLRGSIGRVRDLLGSYAPYREGVDRLSSEQVEIRRTLRRSILGSVAGCLDLYSDFGGVFALNASGVRALPTREALVRPSRKVPNPSVVPRVVVGILAQALGSIYADLLLLEGRLEGSCDPVGEVVLVRESPEASGAQSPESEPTGEVPRRSERVVKRMLDVVAGGFALLAMAPILLAISLAIKLDDPGPALFRQTRVGKNGKLFTLLKFRTMRTDAEFKYPSTLGEESDTVLFKLRSDPRVTRVGRLLRRYSLDELPSLICVLRGDMSLVGPRPALQSEVSAYSARALRRLSVQPGLTGLWQISGRSDLSWAESVRLDNEYVTRASFLFDLKILVRTVWAVISGRGAY